MLKQKYLFQRPLLPVFKEFAKELCIVGTTTSDSFSSDLPPVSMVAPTTELAEFPGITACLTAERAFRHLETNMADIESLLSSFQVHDFRIFAGFDEDLIQAGIGFLEQIHLFLSSEPPNINSLLSQLTSLSAPFTAIVFTKTTQHRVPPSIADFDELAQMYTSAFIDNSHCRKSAFGYPTATCLSQSSASSEAFNPGGGQSSGGESDLTKLGKEQEHQEGDEDGDGDGDGNGDRDGDRDGDGDGDGNRDGGGDRDRDGGGDGDGDGNRDGGGDRDRDGGGNGNGNGDKDGGGNGDRDGGGDGDGDGDGNKDAKWDSEITFSVKAKLSSSSDTRSNRFPFQTLNTNGVLTITRTAEQQSSEPGYGFPTCRIQFNELAANQQTSGELRYAHFHTSIIVDSLQENATINKINPQRTQEYQKEMKVASSSKTSWIFSASALIGAILLKPQLSFTANAGRTREHGTNVEKMMNFSRITHFNMSGVVSWGFYIADRFDQGAGRFTPADQLPSAFFEFVGDDDTPAPPPKHIDVEVSTYWTLLPRRSDNIPDNIWFSRKRISYSNICQIVALKIPSNLRGRHNYHSTLHVYPKLPPKSSNTPNLNQASKASTVTVKVEVKRDDKSIKVNPLVVDSKRDFGVAGIDDWWEDSTLELTSFRRVQAPAANAAG